MVTTGKFRPYVRPMTGSMDEGPVELVCSRSELDAEEGARRQVERQLLNSGVETEVCVTALSGTSQVPFGNPS